MKSHFFIQAPSRKKKVVYEGNDDRGYNRGLNGRLRANVPQRVLYNGNKIMVPVKTVGEGEFLFREGLQLKDQKKLEGNHKNYNFASSGVASKDL